MSVYHAIARLLWQVLTKWFAALTPTSPFYELARHVCEAGMGDDYDFTTAAAPLSAWLAFRHIADVVRLSRICCCCCCCCCVLAHVPCCAHRFLRLILCRLLSLR